MSSGIEGDNIHELDWWDDRDIFSEQFGVTHNESHESRLRVTCVPAQHNSGLISSSGWYFCIFD